MARPAYSDDQREEIETRIKTIALELFAQSGYRNVSLRAIAQVLGMSAPALYRYFESKEALLDAIRADGFEDMRQLLAGEREQAATPVEAVASAMRAYVGFAVEQSALYSLMYELDQGEITQASAHGSRKLAFAEAVRMAEDVLAERGEVGDANLMAHVFWVSAHGLAALAVARQLDLNKSLHELIEPVVQTVLRGLSALENQQGENDGTV